MKHKWFSLAWNISVVWQSKTLDIPLAHSSFYLRKWQFWSSSFSSWNTWVSLSFSFSYFSHQIYYLIFSSLSSKYGYRIQLFVITTTAISLDQVIIISNLDYSNSPLASFLPSFFVPLCLPLILSTASDLFLNVSHHDTPLFKTHDYYHISLRIINFLQCSSRIFILSPFFISFISSIALHFLTLVYLLLLEYNNLVPKSQHLCFLCLKCSLSKYFQMLLLPFVFAQIFSS